MRRLHREPRVLLLRIPQEMAQLAAVEGGLEGARERAHARRGVVVRIDVILDQELPPFFVRTLPDPHDASIERIVTLYRNPQRDWVKQRGPLYFLPNNISFAEVPGLEREVKKTVTPEMIARIADAGKEGRLLFVNTTNLDDASPHVFYLISPRRAAPSRPAPWSAFTASCWRRGGSPGPSRTA